MFEKDLLAQLENTNDRLWSFDPQLICTVVNANMSEDFEQAFGIRLIPGISVLENVPEPICSVWKERYSRAVNGERFTVVDQFQIPGVPEYVEVSFNPIIEHDQVIGVACCSKDISIRKKAEINLSESEANLNAQIENTSDSIWSVNSKYEIVTMNSNFKTEFSHTFACNLQLGDALLNYLPEPFKSTWKERYNRALAGERFLIVDKFDFDTSPIYIEISYNPVKLKDKIVGVACFTRNITALKTSEMEKKAALETRDKLFSIIAHDLRGPMGNINQLTQLLKIKNNSPETQAKVIDMLSTASSSVNALLDNLLNWTMAQQGRIELNPEYINLKELLKSSIAPYKVNAQLKSITVELHVDSQLKIFIDRPTANSIISNLFNNATKFTSNNGKIIVAGEHQENHIYVKIIDNGIGLDSNKVNDILEKTSVLSTSGTSSEKGNGLGLQVCKEFIQLNGGQFIVQSEVGKGSTFGFAIASGF